MGRFLKESTSTSLQVLQLWNNFRENADGIGISLLSSLESNIIVFTSLLEGRLSLVKRTNITSDIFDFQVIDIDFLIKILDETNSG